MMGKEASYKIANAVSAKLNSETALELPKKYKVILLNDDYTPMEFVINVLKRFFYLREEIAVKVMLQVHVYGKGVCGLFTKEIAETKVAEVNGYARNNQYPLLCTMEPA